MSKNSSSRSAAHGLAAAVALTAVTSCSSPQDEAPVVARVDDSTLTVAQLKDRAAPGDDADQQRRLYVDTWVRRQLLYHEAVDRQVDRRPRVQELLAQSRRDIVVAAFLDEQFSDQRIDVNDDDVERYYHLHPDRFRRADVEIRAQQIVLGSRRDATALRQELLRGGDFEAKARDLSIDRDSAGAGGDLGYFTADARPEIWEACAEAMPGELCRNVTIAGAYHIVRLTDRQEAGTVRGLDEEGVRRDIVEALVRDRHRERLDDLLDALRAKHSWSVDEEALGTL